MTEGTSETSNDTMIRDFLAGWERRDTQYILDCITDDERANRLHNANGNAVTLPICGVFRDRGGRIKAWREYFDLQPATDP